jgi:hypothetical protein
MSATVYVCRGVGRQVLYVGCSTNYHRRVREHSALKPWWGEVQHVDKTEWPDWRAGHDEERRLIQSLKPKYNLVTYVTPERPGEDCRIPAVLSVDTIDHPAGTPVVITHQDQHPFWITVQIGERDRVGLIEWMVIREGQARPWIPSQDEISRFHGNSYAYHWWWRDEPQLARYLTAVVA